MRAVPYNYSTDSSLTVDKGNETEFSLTSPYKPAQNKYLIRNDFDLHAYHWDNEEVNLQLDKVFKMRSAGHTLLVMAGGSLMLGGLLKVASGMHDDIDKAESTNVTSNHLLIASGAFLTGSWVFTGIARSKLRKAEYLRKYLKTKKGALLPSDED